MKKKIPNGLICNINILGMNMPIIVSDKIMEDKSILFIPKNKNREKEV